MGQPLLAGPESRDQHSHPSSFPAGLVKAVNTAVDLIVAHFGTSRDPGVKVGWSSEELGCALHTRLFVPRDGDGQREPGGLAK